MPEAASTGTIGATKQIQHCSDALSCCSLTFGEWVACAARDTKQLRGAHAIQCGDAERRAEILAGVVHGLRDTALGQHEAECVDATPLHDRRAAFRIGHARGWTDIAMLRAPLRWR